MIDNSKQILEFLRDRVTFQPKEWFFMLQIIQRSKDGHNKSSKILRTYYIDSSTYFSEKFEEVKEICHEQNARAYINLNPKSYEKVALRMNIILANRLKDKQWVGLDSIYTSAVGLEGGEYKTWVIDVDDPFIDIDTLVEFIDSIPPSEGNVIFHVPTKNGVHLITYPFNVQVFGKEYNSKMIHKNNPTLLYCPTLV